MSKVLVIDYHKCTGCRLCELVCSVVNEGVSNPARSRIPSDEMGSRRPLCPDELPAVHRCTLCQRMPG